MSDPTQAADPSLRLLTGADTEELLTATLELAGAQLLDWSMRDVDHRPGKRTTASYVAKVSWPDGVREETLGASVAALADATPADTTSGLVVTDGDHQVQVWRYPFDPELPALAAVCFPDTAAQVLRALGIACDAPGLRVISYRPRKRAVVEIDTGTARLFVKVVRPRALADLRRRHTLLADAGVPVPECLGWSDDGLLVLAELPGTPLPTALGTHGPDACRPDDLVALLDRFPRDVCELPRRQPWASHATHYAGVIASALPASADRVRALATTIDDALAHYDDGSEPTHGDFYEAQLTVHAGQVRGLLDVDTAGPGRRADDLACLLAHLSVLTVMPPGDAPGRADLVRRTGRAWTAAFDRRVDPVELRVRAAAVVLSLATGPFRTQEPEWQRSTADRIRLAERWVEAALPDAVPATSPF